MTSGYGQLCYSGVASWRWSCKMETLPEQPAALFHTHQHHPPDRSQAQAHPSMQKESSSSAKVTKSLNMLNEYLSC